MTIKYHDVVAKATDLSNCLDDSYWENVHKEAKILFAANGMYSAFVALANFYRGKDNIPEGMNAVINLVDLIENGNGLNEQEKKLLSDLRKTSSMFLN